mgnify:CR=1 FL=1
MINKLVCIGITEDGYNPNECFDDLEGQSALHAAAAIGSLSIVHVLIQVCTIYLIYPPRDRKRLFRANWSVESILFFANGETFI